MRELMPVLKALADENRVRALLAVRSRELCVCQIVELLGLAPSTVSKHMAILKQARLVESRKDGRWIHYRAAGEDAPVEVREIIATVARLLARDRRAISDANRLRQVVKTDRSTLCRGQCRC